MVAVLSFCDSNSSRTEVEYLPFLSGVAGRKPEPGGVAVPFVYGFDAPYGDEERWSDVTEKGRDEEEDGREPG